MMAAPYSVHRLIQRPIFASLRLESFCIVKDLPQTHIVHALGKHATGYSDLTISDINQYTCNPSRSEGSSCHPLRSGGYTYETLR